RPLPDGAERPIRARPRLSGPARAGRPHGRRGPPALPFPRLHAARRARPLVPARGRARAPAPRRARALARRPALTQGAGAPARTSPFVEFAIAGNERRSISFPKYPAPTPLWPKPLPAHGRGTWVASSAASWNTGKEPCHADEHQPVVGREPGHRTGPP